ncbi:MAG: DUF169 domain-containing protein [Desulfarculaceae bacterium]|jgi:hypothetical protein
MESALVSNLRPEFEPVAVVWSDTIHRHVFQFKQGKFGCVVYLMAEASKRGKIAAASRESIACPGGRAALGFGVDFDVSEEILDRYAALFSKGIKSASDKAAYEAHMQARPKNWQDLYKFGERRHCNADLAKDWILHGLPRYDISQKYVLFKPLSLTAPEENLRAVIFPVSPLELSGLVTVAGSVMAGTDPVQVPQGADCTSITAFAYAQAEQPAPRAILGMLGVDGREVMQKRFRRDTLTLTLPAPLYHRMEQEADDCILQTPPWKDLTGK